MDNTESKDSTSTGSPPKSDYKNVLIIFLVLIIVLFTSLGIFFYDFFANFLYSTGWFIGKTSDVITDTGENTLDIINGAVHNGSNLLIKASHKKSHEDHAKHGKHEPSPDTSTNPIQKPITSGKSQWCLVGEYQGRRGCVEIEDSDKCLSGQVFPSQYTCLNPNFSQNVLPNTMTPSGIPPRIDLGMLPPPKVAFEYQQHVESQISDPHH